MIMLLNLVQRIKQGSKTLISGSRNGTGIKGKSNVRKRNELNFNYSELPYHHKHYSEIKGLNTCNALVGT